MLYLKSSVLALLLALLIVAPSHSNVAPITLDVAPIAAIQWGWPQPAAFRYTIRVAETPAWVCTGWIYPVLQWRPDEWPQRRSCRYVDRRTTEEEWGRGYLLPFIGEYRGFAELYVGPEARSPSITVTRPFRVLEGHVN